MPRVSIVLYEFLRSSAYLLRSKYSRRIKKKIFFYMLKINLKYLLMDKFFKFKTEKFFQYNISTFEYANLRQLFEEIFYRSEYYFDSEDKSPVIIDCGANIGLSIIFFKWLYPKSRIYGFEPDKKTFDLLQSNISKNNLKDVHLINAAVSDKDGKIDFFIDPKHIGHMAMSTRHGRMPKQKISVQSILLSSFIKKNKIEKIDLIKMDIEGSEKEVIRDLNKNKIFDRIKKLLIEYHHKIVGEKSCLAEYLEILEKNKFEYQIDARCIPICSYNKDQGDTLLYCYRNK
ncbi:Hexuronic acid methyltransferase AglP [uncultured archaeon]|nr:Hexuronic acid methyltransferase AglP [uncultured archaeon]